MPEAGRTFPEAMRLMDRVFACLGIIAAAGIFLPFIKGDQWWIRAFDFPRVQVLVIALAVLIYFFFRRAHINRYGAAALVVLALASVAQSVQIYPYTIFAAEQVRRAQDPDRPVSIFIANVYQFNRHSDGLIRQIAESAPDIILLTETDRWWALEMDHLAASHPHSVVHPQDNTYGMVLYSKFPLIDAQVRTLVDDSVPSIRARMTMPDGGSFWFYGLHPRPPAVTELDRDGIQDSDQRDAELVVVAKEVKTLRDPVIVAGDFNDVAWSHTTRLFQRLSGLLDPRVGRGFFNTYNAKWPLLRYPLDHLFHSDHFTLIQITRGDHFGSDHFPMFVILNMEPQAAPGQEAPPLKEGDEKEAEEMLDRAKEE
jgi:endonuclease/exonuclease/phosphatase (EEP) superfamily protein YafD